MVAVSVLIRTTGRIAALRDALDSLKHQTFSDFEVIVVEDGPATLEAFLKNYPALSIRYEALGAHKGRSHAGNRALALSAGTNCLFLDEDDIIYTDHLRRLVESTRDKAVAYSFSEERAVERAADGTIMCRGTFKRYRYERFSLLQMIAGNCVPINAVLFRRALFEQAGGFDEDMDCLEDWLLWLRYAALAPDWACVPHVTAIYHVPFDKTARREEFRLWRAKVEERLRSIHFSLTGEALLGEARRFRATLFLRKLYYYVLGFLKW